MTAAFATASHGDPAALRALEAEWWALWRRVPTATPFQSPAWLLPWWQAFAPGELMVVTVRRQGRLVGLAPLYVEEGAYGRRILSLGVSVSDYMDVLLDPEVTEAAGAALSRHLAHAGGLWQEWELTELPPHASALGLHCPPGCRDMRERSSACMAMELPKRPEEVIAGLPRRQRRNVRMAQNRAQRRGEIAVIEADRGTLVPLLDELIRLHRERWASRDQPGVLADPRVIEFHEMAARRLFNAGLLRLYALRIGDTLAGAYYGFNHRERAYAYLMGFDPAYAHVSPGTILFAHALEEAVREGAREMDLLRGSEPYKFGWGAQPRFNQRRVFRRNVSHAA